MQFAIAVPSILRSRWMWWTAAAFPVAVLSHEIGHYVAYRAFGFRGAVLHYGSASHAVAGEFWRLMKEGDVAAATLIHAPWQAGVAAAAGLLMTYATIAACVLIARRRPHPFVVGLGLIAAIRFLGSALVVVMFMFGRRQNGSDEQHVAMTLNVPELAMHLVGITVLFASWRVLLRFPAQEPGGRAATLAGIVLGGILYIGVLGPWLLP